jgi:ribosome modulation factor
MSGDYCGVSMEERKRQRLERRQEHGTKDGVSNEF